MVKKYWRKLWAPVLITILILTVLIGYLFAFLFVCTVYYAFNGSALLPVLFCLCICGGCGVSVFVLWERIKEIESGEEDDISQY